jgi:chitinase
MNTSASRLGLGVLVTAACALSACSSEAPSSGGLLPFGGSGGSAAQAGSTSGGSSSVAGSGVGGSVAMGGSVATGGSGATGGGGTNSAGGGTDAGGSGGTPTQSGTRMVAYLPDWSGSFSSWADKIDFSKMTYLDLSFANPDASHVLHIGGGGDASLDALIAKAHAAGTKVMISLAGASDSASFSEHYTPQNVDTLVSNIDAFIDQHQFDGVDVDVESPENMGQNYDTFVTKLIAKVRPKNKLVTAAVAEWLQDGMADETLLKFDFINVMSYLTYDIGVKDMKYYNEEKGVPKDKIVFGVPFYGDCKGSCDSYLLYKDILQDYPNAWQSDRIEQNGATITYTGEATMAKKTQFSKEYGGVMFWELSGDAAAPHSLYKVIQDNL